MSRTIESYRHYLPALALSIERYTARVPADGKFHVLKEGKILASFSSLKKAEEYFRKIVKESGYVPPSPTRPPGDPTAEDIERYMDAKDLYWATSHKFGERGGKGGRGGV